MAGKTWHALAILILVTAMALNTRGEHPLAHLKFEVSLADSIQTNRTMVTQNTSFLNGSLYLNGRYEHSSEPMSSKAILEVPEISSKSLAFSLDFLPLDFRRAPQGLKAAVSNKVMMMLNMATGGWLGGSPGGMTDHDSILTCGTSARWLGINHSGGNLVLTLNNQTFSHPFPGVSAAPGRWHNLICSADFEHRVILLMLDGVALEPVKLPENFKLDLKDGPVDHTDKEFSLQNYSNGSAFHGYVDNLKVFASALSGEELREEFTKTAGDRPTWSPLLQNADHQTILLLLIALAAAGAVIEVVRRRARARREPSG